MLHLLGMVIATSGLIPELLAILESMMARKAAYVNIFHHSAALI